MSLITAWNVCKKQQADPTVYISTVTLASFHGPAQLFIACSPSLCPPFRWFQYGLEMMESWAGPGNGATITRSLSPNTTVSSANLPATLFCPKPGYATWMQFWIHHGVCYKVWDASTSLDSHFSSPHDAISRLSIFIYQSHNIYTKFSLAYTHTLGGLYSTLWYMDLLMLSLKARSTLCIQLYFDLELS